MNEEYSSFDRDLFDTDLYLEESEVDSSDDAD